MIETLTLITLSIILLVLFRPGKTPPLARPLVIERVGQYRMELAPMLNLAQPFIERIGKRMQESAVTLAEGGRCVFEVRDKQVMPRGGDHYVLVIERKQGLWNFAALPPQDGQAAPCGTVTRPLADLVQEVASGMGITVSYKFES